MTELTYLPATTPIDVMPAWLPEAAFGTTATDVSPRPSVCATTTAEVPSEPDLDVSTASEVRRLRDAICSGDGITRIDLARALGVDRRSLSGWVSGEIRPTPERIATLRSVARIVDDIRAAHPGRARDLMTGEGPRGSVIDALANGELPDIPSSWRLVGPGAIGRPRRPATTTVPHEQTDQPLHAAALAAYLAGKLVAPPRATTVRDPDIYEIEPETAERTYAEEPAARPRRRPYL